MYRTLDLPRRDCTVLYRTVPHRTARSSCRVVTVLHRTVPYCTALYRILLYCRVVTVPYRKPYCTVLYRTVPRARAAAS
eukprot:5257430-Pyramimonas_sp.AAC.1